MRPDGSRPFGSEWDGLQQDQIQPGLVGADGLQATPENPVVEPSIIFLPAARRQDPGESLVPRQCTHGRYALSCAELAAEVRRCRHEGWQDWEIAERFGGSG